MVIVFGVGVLAVEFVGDASVVGSGLVGISVSWECGATSVVAIWAGCVFVAFDDGAATDGGVGVQPFSSKTPTSKIMMGFIGKSFNFLTVYCLDQGLFV